MKKILCLLFFGIILLNSCFRDEGNYDYLELNEPNWLINKEQPVRFVAKSGQNITLQGSSMFKWDNDAEKRAKEVRYEWKLNDIVVGTDLDLTISTEELMKKANIKNFSKKGPTYGTFSVIDRKSEIEYMAQYMVFFYAKYSGGDWFLLFDREGKAGISSLTQVSIVENGVEKDSYKYEKNAYNGSKEITGKPIRMNWAQDRHLGSQGSITVITDESAFEIKAENMEFNSEFEEDQFLNGLPPNFKIVARADFDGTDTSKPGTFLATTEGLLYTRLMSKNYLGGKFLSEPYYIDDNGYKITKFGNTTYNNVIPCYDEKNRRIVLVGVVSSQQKEGENNYFQTNVIRCRALYLDPTTENSGAPVNDYPQGTEMLYIGPTGHMARSTPYVAVYNDPSFPSYTFVGDFQFDSKSMTARAPWTLNRFTLEDRLDETSCIISSANRRKRNSPINRTMFYSVGNKVRYVQRSASADFGYKDVTTSTMNLPEVTSKIIYMTFDFYYATTLLIACENGDLFLYDIAAPNLPRLLYQTNTGEKLLSAKQLGNRNSFQDMYNH